MNAISLKKHYLLKVAVILWSFSAFGQHKSILINEISNLEQVVLSESLNYYGLDVSLIHFVDAKNAFNDQHIKNRHLGPWLVYYHKEIPPQKYIAKWLGFKDKFSYDLESVQSRLDSVPQDWISSSPKEVSITDVHNTIKSYQLKENQRLGFVIHPVEFNEDEKRILCYFTFFDIATREILWISQVQSEPSGKGYNQAYGLGMVACTKTFVDKLYSKEMKKAFQ